MSDKVQSEIEQIELSMEAAKEKVNLMEALKRLENNKDFQFVIGDNYLQKYATRLVRLRASYTMQKDPAQLAYIDNTISAIGFLANHFQFIHQEGVQAEEAVAASIEELNLAHDEAAKENEV